MGYCTVLELGFGEEVEDKARRGAVAEMAKVFAKAGGFPHELSIPCIGYEPHLSRECIGYEPMYEWAW